MNRLFTTICLCVNLFAFIACQHSQKYADLLEVDSQKVSNMDSGTLKAYEEQLSHAVDFYQKKCLDQESMTANFKLAKVQMKSQDFLNATVSLKSALAYAEKVGDIHTSGEIYKLLAVIYRMTFDQTESLKCLLRAERCFAETADSTSRYRMLLDVGKMYLSLQDYKRSEGCLRRVLTWAEVNNDTLMLSKTMTEYARALIKKSVPDPEQAIQLMTDAVDLYGAELTVDDKSTLAYAYYLVGEKELADQMISQAGELADDTISRLIHSYWQYRLNERRPDSPETHRWHEVTDSLQSMLMSSALDRSIQSAEIAYYSSSSEQQEQQLAKRKHRTNLILLVSMPLFLLLICITAIMLRRNKKKMMAFDEKVHSLTDDKHELDCSREQFTQQMKHGELSMFLNDLIESYYERKGMPKAEVAVYRVVETYLEKIQSEKAVKLQIENTVNLLGDDIVQRFKEDCPGLRDVDYMLFTYIMMGFSSISIGVFMGLEPEQVYRLKYKLKQKVKKSESSEKETYLQILS